MHFIQIFVAAFFIFASSLPASAQQLWNGTSYGMSKGDIKKMFPMAVPAKNTKPLGNKAQPIFDLNEIDLEGHKFRATFFFRGEKLTQVNLSPEESEGIDWMLWMTNRLETILSYKYGKPYKTEGNARNSPDLLPNNTDFYKNKSIHWENGKTQISVAAYGTNVEARLVIVYLADFLDAASKL